MNDSRTNGHLGEGGDEISELTQLLPPPAAPVMTAGRSQALRAHLVAEVAREQRGVVPGHAPSRRQSARRPQRRARLMAGLAGAVAVGAAAAVGVSVLASGGSPGGGASPAAVTLLAKIATAAARQPAPKVTDSEIVYIRSKDDFRVAR